VNEKNRPKRGLPLYFAGAVLGAFLGGAFTVQEYNKGLVPIPIDASNQAANSEADSQKGHSIKLKLFGSKKREIITL
ncbi:hypothetical protein HMI55_006055, partial [Coelomomyces lativittatus]